MLTLSPVGNFDDFLVALRTAGFLPGAFDWSDGSFSLAALLADKVKWHTEDADTDPWVWRRLVLDECDDIAYGKLFLSKAGYITREWYPHFFAVRRGGTSFEQEYRDGKFSPIARKVYRLLQDFPVMAAHDIKTQGGFDVDERNKVERVLVELQMKMFITPCGEARKVSKEGEPYGWPSTVYCLAEAFFDNLPTVSPDDALRQIADRVREIVHTATDAEIGKLVGVHRRIR